MDISGTSDAMNNFLETMARTKVVDRDARESYWAVTQAMYDLLYQEGLLPYQIHCTGSRFEGLPREVCGDQDFMYTSPSYPIVLIKPDDNQDADMLSDHLLAVVDPLQPAYIKLKLNGGGREETMSPTLKKAFTSNGFLSSTKFVTSIGASGHTIHGPAITKSRFPFHPEKGTADFVHSFKSPYWPPSAQEFQLRDRPNGWPTDQLIKSMCNGGCHVVPVGHQLSAEKDLQWRMSFSLAERMLLREVDSAMHCCMYVLKGIFKEQNSVINAGDVDSKDIFTSYFLKTACLWIFENLPKNHSFGVLGLCHEVIDRLVSCFDNHDLPNYFIPNQNILGHLSEEECKRVVSWLSMIKGDFWCNAMSSIRPAQNVQQRIKDMCVQLGVKQTGRTTDFRELHMALHQHEDAETILNTVTEKIGPECDWFKIWVRYWLGLWSSYREPLMYEVLQSQLSEKPGYDITKIPDIILLPLIEQIDCIVKDELVPMFKTSMYRHIGDLFHTLAACYTKIDRSKSEECFDKAAHFYDLGGTMVYPDGWTDNGFGGSLLLAKLYRLKGPSDSLTKFVNELRQILTDAICSDEYVNSQSYLLIHKDYEVACSVWNTDVFFKNLIDSWTNVDVRPHPIVLACYFIVIEALTADDLGTAIWAKTLASECILKMKNNDQITCSTAMVDFLDEKVATLESV